MAITAPAAGTYIELDDAWADPGWTRVPNSIARCTTISRRVKGWILEVASHAPGRRLTFAEMLACSTDGRHATYATINEAVNAGIVTRSRERDTLGRLGATVYRVHVTPQNPRSAPLSKCPDLECPDPESRETKREKTNNLEDQTQEDSIQHGSAAEPSSLRDDGFQDQNIVHGEPCAPSPRQRGAGPRSNQDPKFFKNQDRKHEDRKAARRGKRPPAPQAAPAAPVSAKVSQAPRTAKKPKRAPRPRPDVDWDDYGWAAKLERLTKLIDDEVELLPNEAHAVESMIRQGAHWKKIMTAILRQREHGYGGTWVS